ncbi:MAG: drug/metabolite transporter (DMT)-like permease [Parasphingorhabdus sp.]|jgi:drug/metabolite transporter (DMT)-like permease
MRTSALPDKGIEYGAPAIFVLLWSTGFLGAKWGLPYIEPATFLTIRFAIVTVLFSLLVVFLRAPLPSTPRAWLHIATSGCLVHGVYLGGVFASISLGVNAGVSALIVGIQPLITAVLVGPWLGEKITSRQWAGFFVGVLGVSLVVMDSFTFESQESLGLLLCVIALIAISIGTVYQKKFCADMDLRSGSAIQFFAATVFVSIFALIFESREINWHPQFFLALGWLCIVLSLGAVSLLMWLIRRGAASKVASLFYLVPPLVAVESWLLFDEIMQTAAIAGLCLCTAGVWLVLKPARSATKNS